MSSDLAFFPVPGFESYSVNRAGQVKGKRGRVLACVPDSYGYPTCSIWMEDKWNTRRVHGLVLLTFTGPRPEGFVCNHKDGIKTNNCVSNLEWVTVAENNLHAYRVLRRKGCGRKLTAEQVREIRTSPEGLCAISKRFGMHPAVIRRVRMSQTYREVKREEGPELMPLH